MSERRRLARAAGLSLLALGSALAQDKAPAEAPLPKVEISASQDKYDARRLDTASKIVVTQEEIAKHGDSTLADVLKPVSAHSPYAGRGGGEIRMRGLGSGYTQILLNGEAAPPGFTLDSLSPALIERIEIVRSGSAEFSAQGIAGTINIVLKSKVVAAQRELKLTVEGSETFRSANANFQLSDKREQLSYTLGGNLRSGSFRQDNASQQELGIDATGQPNLLRDGRHQDRGRFTGLSLTPKFNLSVSRDDTLSSQTVVNLNRWQGDNATRWSVVLGSPPPYSLDRTQPQTHSDMLRTDLNWVRKFDDGAKLDAKFGLNASQRDSDYFEQGYDATGVQKLDSSTLSRAHEQGVTSLGKFTMPFVQDHALSTGWDAGSTRRSETRVQHDLALAGLPALDSDEGFDARLNKLALYAQDEWTLTPQWSLYLGLRWEALDTLSRGDAFTSVANRSRVLSPLLQTLWKLPDSKNDQLRFALTRSYKAPPLSRLMPRRYTSSDNSAISPDWQGNPALRPELATGLDLSWEHFFGEGALLSASAYRREIGDFTRDNLSLQGQRWVSMPVNDGRARTRGVEFEAKFPLRSLLHDAPAMDLRFNLARNASTVEQVPGPNNRLADQTPLSANLGLDYRAGADFSLGGSFSYKGGGPVRVSATTCTRCGSLTPGSSCAWRWPTCWPSPGARSQATPMPPAA